MQQPEVKMEDTAVTNLRVQQNSKTDQLIPRKIPLVTTKTNVTACLLFPPSNSYRQLQQFPAALKYK